MYGEDIPVAARVVSIERLSAHADREELLRWVGTAPKPPRRVFLVHGEGGALTTLGEAVMERFGVAPEIPLMGQEVDLSDLLQ